MYGYIAIVAAIFGLIGGFIGGIWGYQYESSRQKNRDKKQLDAVEAELLNERDGDVEGDDGAGVGGDTLRHRTIGDATADELDNVLT